MNKKNLDRELFDWKQSKIEQGKFPCICGHLKSNHVKSMCIACHGMNNTFVHREGHTIGSCFHKYEKMPNLDVIEWVAENKKDIEK